MVLIEYCYSYFLFQETALFTYTALYRFQVRISPHKKTKLKNNNSNFVAVKSACIWILGVLLP